MAPTVKDLLRTATKAAQNHAAAVQAAQDTAAQIAAQRGDQPRPPATPAAPGKPA